MNVETKAVNTVVVKMRRKMKTLFMNVLLKTDGKSNNHYLNTAVKKKRTRGFWRVWIRKYNEEEDLHVGFCNRKSMLVDQIV